MIDFRYHVVSLVSVFLALAVGIVLGAGPLKGTLGDQLNSQVGSLRTETADLRTQVKTAQTAADNRDTFTRSVLPQLVAQQLAGQRVAVVSVPGVDSGAVKPLLEALRAAGATVTARVSVRPGWVDPARAADRDGLVGTLAAASSSSAAADAASSAQASAASSSASAAGLGPERTATVPPPTAPGVPPTVDGATGTSTALAGLLAGALLSRDPAATVDPGLQARLDALARAGLIRVDGDVTARATEAVLLVPAVPSGGPAASPSPAADPVAQWTVLAVALDAAGGGAVVTGPASSATDGGVVAAVRSDDDLTRVVSTVDTGGTPMGDVATVLALREQGLGGAGRYGFTGGVDAPLPGGGHS